MTTPHELRLLADAVEQALRRGAGWRNAFTKSSIKPVTTWPAIVNALCGAADVTEKMDAEVHRLRGRLSHYEQLEAWDDASG